MGEKKESGQQGQLDFEYDNRELGFESQNGKLKVHQS